MKADFRSTTTALTQVWIAALLAETAHLKLSTALLATLGIFILLWILTDLAMQGRKRYLRK